MRHELLALATAIVWSTASAALAEPPPMAVVIRVYVPVDAGAIDRALAEAAAVLAQARVVPVWVGCGAHADGRGCDRPLAAGELAVRFSSAPVPPGYHGRLPLGDSLIDRDRGDGALATIYTQRVLWLARAADVDPARLLGRALAHEIGHLLIGTAQHSRSGLMRAVWTREDLERDRPSEWRFTAADAAAIAHAHRAALPRVVTVDATR